MSYAFDTLKARYPDDFTESWNPQHRALTYGHDHAFIVYSGDTLHQNTIDDSNMECIYEELANKFPGQVHLTHRPYTSEIYVSVESLEDDEELADQVLDVRESLEEYAIYDCYHHSDLESERLAEYVEDVLIVDIANDLGMDSPEKVRQWLITHYWAVWDYFDGSVDDAPFNTEALTELIREDLAS